MGISLFGGCVKTILSIDDEPRILECIRLMLEPSGYRIYGTTVPDEAAALAVENEVSLVTLEAQTPFGSGFDVLRKIKAWKRGLPVLFVTGAPECFSVDRRGVADLWEKEFADGNTDILYKPFDADALLEKVMGLIGSPRGQSPESSS